MDYKQFDKRAVQGTEREQIIKKALKKQPKTIRDLMDDTGMLYHQIQSCLLRMSKKSRGITKKKIGVETYWGLIPSERT
ncbi:MAG: hypothetical protein ACFFG0_20020 [Candidatus Thorarchaeota archaeon]